MEVLKYLQFVLLPVDNDSCDLLVHKNEDGAEQSWDEGDDCGPPRVGPHRVYNPATIIPGWLTDKRMQLITKTEESEILYVKDSSSC